MPDEIEPKFETQMDDNGYPEKVDVSNYNFRILCEKEGCKEVRYIKSQDRHQVKLCKFHQAEKRLIAKRKAERRRRSALKGFVTDPSQ